MNRDNVKNIEASHVKVVYRPLVRKAGESGLGARGVNACEPAAVKRPDPFLRPANEDDDGYDPYSDRPETRPLFEESPWD